jgi:hypothetical protein
MEFYKIYYKLHRNTGFYEKMIIIDRIKRPEYYETKRKKSEKALRKFYFGITSIGAAINSNIRII